MRAESITTDLLKSFIGYVGKLLLSVEHVRELSEEQFMQFAICCFGEPVIC